MNGSCTVSSPQFATLLYLHVPQFHGIHQGNKTNPKKSIRTLYVDKEFQKMVRSMFKWVQNEIVRKPELSVDLHATLVFC